MMNLQRPPRLAVLLLKWFGLVQDEPFAGDLIEEFQSGRTAGWFWRQTFGAIGAVLRRGARRPEVRSLLVTYGIVTASAARFLQIHGPVVTTLKSLVIAMLIVIAASHAIRRWLKAPQYGGKFLLEQWLRVIVDTALMIFAAGRIGSPLWIVGINGIGFFGDLWRALRRSTPAARTD
jgi:hypothetical protein